MKFKFKLCFIFFTGILFLSCKNGSKINENLKNNFYLTLNNNWIEENVKKELPDYMFGLDLMKESENKNIEFITKELRKETFVTEYPLYTDLHSLFIEGLNIKKRNEVSKSELKDKLSAVYDAKSISELLEVERNIFFKTGFSVFLNFILYPMYSSIKIQGLELLPYIDYEEKENKAYRKLIEDIFEYYGYKKEDAESLSSRIIKFEKDIKKIQNKYSANIQNFENKKIEELQTLFTGVNLENLFPSYHLSLDDYFYVDNFDKLKSVFSFYNDENLSLLKDYFTFRFIYNFIKVLDEEALQISYSFSKALLNYPDSKVSDKTVEETVIAQIINFDSKKVSLLYEDFSLGSLNQKKVIELCQEIKESFCSVLEKTELLGKNQKRMLINRIREINFIFEEDRSVLSDNYDLEGKSFFERICCISSMNKKRELKNFKTFNKDAYRPLSAFEVNAYYLPFTNSVYIPVGILQEPFYSEEFLFEENLGSLGNIIAHEIAHSIFVNDSLLDENNYKHFYFNYEYYQKYREWQKKIVKLYSNYKNSYEIKEDGVRTFYENSADILGMQACLNVLKMKNSLSDNYSNFFEFYARSKVGVTSDLYNRTIYLTETHFLPEARVNCVLKNFNEFYEVYSVGQKDKMYISPKHRARF